MSMPIIEKSDNPIDREQSVNNLIESIALMEAGLSHVINAEGEKIQKVVKHDQDVDVPIEDLIRVNESAQKMVNTVAKLEMLLQNKLDIAKELDTATGGDIITGMGLSVQRINADTTEEAEVSPNGSPLALSTTTYLNGFTINAENNTFTVNNTGSYLVYYNFALGDAAIDLFSIGLKINGIVNEDTILHHQGNTPFDHQLDNSVILNLTANDTIQLVLIGTDGERIMNSGVAASLVITRML